MQTSKNKLDKKLCKIKNHYFRISTLTSATNIFKAKLFPNVLAFHI